MVVKISPYGVDKDRELLVGIDDELLDRVSHPAELALLPPEGPH